MDLPSIMYTYFGIEWTARGITVIFNTSYKIMRFSLLNAIIGVNKIRNVSTKSLLAQTEPASYNYLYKASQVHVHMGTNILKI